MARSKRGYSAVLGLLLALTLPWVARAQDRDEALDEDTPSFQSVVPRTFGTASEVSLTVPAVLFLGEDSAHPDDHATSGLTGARNCIVANCHLLASVQLPAGALVTRIQVDGCDDNGVPDFDYVVRLRRAPALEAAGTLLVTVSSTGSPGCTFVSGTLATPETIDNSANSYFLLFASPAADTSLRFQAVRVFYNLQVRPAPVAATFGDVPTSHPFFQFIEALVASGITAGCSAAPPLYCPDAPLTRGQMAVFLGKALGLHFAP